ncbi:hypothetical protein ONS95_008494 [Cadophora gregata]|uniref:uncharacterized protein n=1 Tax=Cadophora gregata TaxID=51156 RepID=UPI0026DA85BD|nr:uncharacterized protein ONS95_008494 [Cadophora gregata]KAK0100155.1 hypothetical protein ONS95_008494 [Cadophora gregata]
MPPRSHIYDHMDEATLQRFVAQEMRMAESRNQAVLNDGLATVAAIQTASQQRVNEITRLGQLEGQYLNDLYAEKEAAAREEGTTREREVNGLGEAEADCIRDLYEMKKECARGEGMARQYEWQGIGQREGDEIGDMYREVTKAKIKVVEDAAKTRAKDLRGVEVANLNDMYGYERDAKVEAVEAEHKAILKEIKTTKEHERKCIVRMWAAEAEARVLAVRAENELRMELLREESKLKMDLMRQESAARRELDTLKEIEVEVRSPSVVSRESSRVAGKRKRVS